MDAAGLILNILASWALAYPILWGYPKANKRAIAQHKLEVLHRLFADLDARIDGSAYAPDQKKKEKAAVRDQFADEESSLTAELERLGPAHDTRSFWLSALGMGLLSFGFVLQLWALVNKTPPASLKFELGIETDTLPPFGDASAAVPSPAAATRICEIRSHFAAAGISTAIVVGRYDHRRLTADAEERFRTNIGLAQARADTVAALFGAAGTCSSAPLFAIPLIGGNRLSLGTKGLPKDQRSAFLAADRAVIIHGLRIDSTRAR